jgi:hypothetical protein
VGPSQAILPPPPDTFLAVEHRASTLCVTPAPSLPRPLARSLTGHGWRSLDRQGHRPLPRLLPVRAVGLLPLACGAPPLEVRVHALHQHCLRRALDRRRPKVRLMVHQRPGGGGSAAGSAAAAPPRGATTMTTGRKPRSHACMHVGGQTGTHRRRRQLGLAICGDGGGRLALLGLRRRARAALQQQWQQPLSRGTQSRWKNRRWPHLSDARLPRAVRASMRACVSAGRGGGGPAARG